VILLAMRWYLRFGPSYRDHEELLAERGIEVDHVSLYRWVQHFTRSLRRGHCEFGVDARNRHLRVAAAFDQLAQAT
jgi:transposase-like protein